MLWSAIVEDLDAFYVVASNVAIALMLELGGGVDFDHSAQNEPAVDTIPTYKHTRHSQGSYYYLAFFYHINNQQLRAASIMSSRLVGRAE